MSCSIIIVTYNSSSSINACLTPLVDMQEFEVVVVDNGSNDGTVPQVKKAFPSVNLIALQDNPGFGRACNIGVAASKGSLVILLNPDAVAQVQALKIFIEFFEKHPRAGIAGGRLVDLSGLPLQSMGDRPTLLRLVLEKLLEWVAKRVSPCGRVRRAIGRYCAKFRVANGAEQVDWVSGAALCCRRQAWKVTGGFDENFFLYYEDVDLCLRAAQVGWEVWHVPAAVVSHQSGVSFAGNLGYQKSIYYANQRYFFQKHQGSVAASFVALAQRLYRWRYPVKNLLGEHYIWWCPFFDCLIW